MAETFDIAIVGAGITGCAIARQLARYDLSICVVEAANDIALGASKANGGLVHAGYDPAPGTVKAQVNARGCELYGTWAQELGFLFRRTGSMVLGFTQEWIGREFFCFASCCFFLFCAAALWLHQHISSCLTV